LLPSAELDLALVEIGCSVSMRTSTEQGTVINGHWFL
jgi:hypothetical protein